MWSARLCFRVVAEVQALCIWGLTSSLYCAMIAGMSYPGGKSGSGVYQQIINQIPPHDVYIAPFFGHDGVYSKIKPAPCSIAVDIDTEVIEYWKGALGLTVICTDALVFLGSYDWKGGEFVYCDPPYLKFDVDGSPVRKSGKDIYTHEFGDVGQHEELLTVLRSLPCMVAVSGYWSRLYADMLNGWRSISFNAVCRDGSVAREWLWMNYPVPVALHDYRYLGDNFRESEKITRQKRRWVARLQRMDPLQRYALLNAIDEYRDGSGAGQGMDV